MIVEVVGGPEDGCTLEVPDGSRYLTMAVRRDSSTDIETLCGEKIVSMQHLDLTIHTRPGGAHFVFWRES